MRRRIGFWELFDSLGMALFGMIVIALEVNQYLISHSLDAVEILGVLSGALVVVIGIQKYLRMLRHG